MTKIATAFAFLLALTAPAFAFPSPVPAPELGTSVLGFALAAGVAHLLKRRAAK